MSKEGCKLQGS